MLSAAVMIGALWVKGIHCVLKAFNIDKMKPSNKQVAVKDDTL